MNQQSFYYFLIKNNLNWVYYLINTAKSLLFIIRNKCKIFYRDELQFPRAKTFIPYLLDSQKVDNLLKLMDKNGKKNAKKMLTAIEEIAFNNICSYNKLYNNEDEKEKKRYINYFNKSNSYFKALTNNLLNEYYIDKSLNSFDIKDYVDWKAILDCGAFVWDSCIEFAKYFNSSIVYWFEPQSDNRLLFEQTISHFDMKNRIVPIDKGVWDKDEVLKISNWWAGAAIWVTEGEDVHITTIDDFSKNNNLEVGLIKRDIEWFEYNSVIWAEQTIKKFKPILFISVYHTGKDFFEIPPLIDSRNCGYKFSLVRRNCIPAFADTLLVCYL